MTITERRITPADPTRTGWGETICTTCAEPVYANPNGWYHVENGNVFCDAG